MSEYQILYLLFRTIESEVDEKKPQFQVFCKNDEHSQMKEYPIGKVVQFKVLPKSNLSFRFYIHTAFDVHIVDKSILVKNLNLQAFEPKTLSLSLEAENGTRYFLVFDAFIYYIQNEEEQKEESIILFDFKLNKLIGLDNLVERVEKPLTKKSIGFYMVEYELVFQYLAQIFTVNFTSNGENEYFKKNTFAADKADLKPLKVRVSKIFIVSNLLADG